MKKLHQLTALQNRTEKLKSVLLFLLIFFGICLIFSGWFAVLYSPQYAFVSKESSVKSIRFTMNNTDYSESTILATTVKKPKAWLTGVSEIFFELNNELGTLLLKLSDEKVATFATGDYMPIYLNDVTFKRTEEFMENNYDHCVQEQVIDDKNIVIGKVRKTTFDQGIKKISFEFDIDLEEIQIPTRLHCFGDSPYNDQIITVTLNSLFLDISHESDVIYEWTGKGGPTYRL